ncbi:MAG: hypothetical protein F6J97_14210 [Leptolyngbya sp. SIO4C1]|nr:hypothetical protein [Leptolyngbya sp. SIO4C1]
MRYSFFTYLMTSAAFVLALNSCFQTARIELPSPNAVSSALVHATAPLRFEGDLHPLGAGTVRAYVELDARSRPQEIGVILTEAALDNLPNHAAEVVLPLPTQAHGTAFDHIGFNWRSHGHDPMPIYGEPHFDIHFYTITPEQRAEITAVGANLGKVYKTPDAELVPTGYVMAPDSAEPGMGSHWVDTAAEELQGSPHGFSRTLIYGFHDGEMTFIEPMVTTAFLKSQQDDESTFAVPSRYTRAGSYPTAYRITYDEAAEEYVFALTQFVPAQPEP